MKALLLGVIVCIATLSFAEPITINLLPEGKNLAKPIQLPLETAELSIAIKTILSEFEGSEHFPTGWKTDRKPHVINLPMESIDERTLRAIASSLVSLKVLQKKKKNTFKTLKPLVLTYFADAKSNDALKFLIAANFLHIDELLRPAAAAWVDEYRKENSGVLRKWLWGLSENLRKDLPTALKGVPEELIAYIEDYWILLNPKEPVVITLPFKADTIAIAGNNLFAVTMNNISQIDLTKDTVVRNIPMPKNKIFVPAPTACGPRLYVTSGPNVTVADIATGSSKDISHNYNVSYVCLPGNKLYELSNQSLSEIDIMTGKKIGEPIKLRNPMMLLRDCLVVANNKLYVLGHNGKIDVVDLATNRLMDNAIEHFSNAGVLATAGNKVYVTSSNDHAISVINTTTDKIVDEIEVRWRSRPLFAVGKILFVANGEFKTISMIDTTTDKVIGQPIAVPGEPRVLAYSDGKLYIASWHENNIVLLEVNMPYLERIKLKDYYSK